MVIGRKILTVCEEGNNRSVALGLILKEKYGKESLACGINKVSVETLGMLVGWADTIIITDSRIHHFMFDRNKEKVIYFDVGPDRYFRPFHEELTAQFKDYLKTVVI